MPLSRHPSIIVLLLAPVATLAGCLGEAGGAEGTGGADGAAAPSLPTLPPPMREDIAVAPGLDGPAEPVVGRCAAQPWCFEYPFTVHPGPDVVARAWLNWTLPSSDWDLDLVAGGNVLARADAHGPALGESLAATLGPGDYAWVTVPYLVQRDSATLEAAFSWA